MDDWGAIEEVLLLDAVEHDGFGNWSVENNVGHLMLCEQQLLALSGVAFLCVQGGHCSPCGDKDSTR